jgi:hypothetical protein
MQIRVRKNTVSLIRTVYVPTLGRGRPESLGVLPKDATSAPDELLDRLTDVERWQLKNWLASNERMRSRTVQQGAATDLPATLRDIAAWYRQQPKSANLAALAKASRDEWSELLAAMSAAGVGRTRKRLPGNKKTRVSGS